MKTNGVEVLAEVTESFADILTPEALAFVAGLHRAFEPRRNELLERRREVQARLDAGEKPRFPSETADIRSSDWKVAAIPHDLMDRRVEITGPVDRKMVINALNCGANVFMADFEDANSPTWNNTIHGQVNMRDAVNRSISFTQPETGKHYQLNEEIATLLVRPRGWHLVDKHILIDGRPVSGSLLDFGLHFFHNAREALGRGTGPYYYLPKLEGYREARLWNDVFIRAQEALGVPHGSIRATVLIENVLASFEMDEILFELRDHSAGLNCGRWDYIFSVISKFRHWPNFTLPDRAEVTMTRHLMRSYSLLVIKTCHKRGIHAMGGMAAQIPIKGDAAANEEALEKVRADKEREASDGHDGTWVAHPGLVNLARDVFDKHMPGPNQIELLRDDVDVSADDLLRVPGGNITPEGIRTNIDVATQYLESWLRGIGCVPIYNLMEDAATAEISRAQLWQWINDPNAVLTDGRSVSPELFRELVPEAMDRIRSAVGEQRFEEGRYSLAQELLAELVLADEFAEFLTIPAYEHLD